MSAGSRIANVPKKHRNHVSACVEYSVMMDGMHTSINSSPRVLELKDLSPQGYLRQLNLPQSLPPHRSVLEVPGVRVPVNATKHNLSTIGFGTPQTKGEDRLVNEAFVDQAVEWRRDVVDGKGVVSEAQDTIEP